MLTQSAGLGVGADELVCVWVVAESVSVTLAETDAVLDEESVADVEVDESAAVITIRVVGVYL